MRARFSILAFLMFLSCKDTPTQNYQHQFLEKENSEIFKNKIISKQFSIENFQTQCDSLLKK